ncbi:hypothetical protein [Sphingomonas sp.]|jgi:hypothetical protein|uniref:hypothetical protein n=1 Tax=Sphingomonas sp. TaxID=28214 RepID=UPI0035638B48
MTIINGFIRTGVDNHRVKHPDHVVLRARLLRQRGWKPSEIREHLRDEGHSVNLKTLQNWLLENTRTGI